MMGWLFFIWSLGSVYGVLRAVEDIVAIFSWLTEVPE